MKGMVRILRKSPSETGFASPCGNLNRLGLWQAAEVSDTILSEVTESERFLKQEILKMTDFSGISEHDNH